METELETTGGPRLFNRELSWLDFNARVLELAEDESTPLLERAKFLAIFSGNLDEFFQVRIAGLKDQVAAGITRRTPDGRTPAQQLIEIRDALEPLLERQEQAFLESLVPALAAEGIVYSDVADLDDEDRKFLDEEFDSRIFPVLTPLAVDPGHPFPYISDLSLNLAVVVRNPDTGDIRFARVKVPSLLPRFVVLPDGERFVPLEQVIGTHLGRLFPGMEIDEQVAFRVTRNADLTLEDEEADDLLAAVEVELRRRRFGRAVRLEIDARMSPEIRDLLVRELEVEEEDVYVHRGPLGLGGLFALVELDRPELKDPVWSPITQLRLAEVDDEPVDMFAELRRGDILVHHPYSSFATSVEEFIRQASVDPQVLAIKLTLYRTSGDSSIIESLIRAAEGGKQVAALVELKARFDEQANIEWARRLEKAGVHVAYGFVDLKIHTKTALVVREEGDRIHRYVHIGTGNYNPKTAKLYEDLGLLSADDVLGSDLSQLFNFLTGYSREVPYQRLLVAPHWLRDSIVELVRNEVAAGPEQGRITMKMNSLVDARLIEELYAASAAGIPVDLIVRGICCLRPGVPGMSETIRVRSIVGRYLEHSRIYRFANGAGPGRAAYYIGSADLMPRNLDRRVEALVSVLDPALQDRLQQVLDVNLADDQHAWVLEPSGRWVRRKGPEGVSTHERLQELALVRAGRRAE
ncbi:polyphosphate kinase 1 [Actinomarinicola tropica]|uniref:polyphosphate kinase 1 n=1 Tax=Actinomarinicola tropica TaxID=2789776 RepID=UPI001E554D44|nr:polyphosphate kinase 1 [Actinomarinicola tropica]